ncbi:MAG: hypothetical protein Q8M10_09970, partial [Methylotenera sp.]|nr:hypothetical protein [Methylotenera sp.]
GWPPPASPTCRPGSGLRSTNLLSVLLATLFLTACDKTPVVVNVPADTVVVPGPAGPAGKTGEQGIQGDVGVKGNTGDAGVQGNDGNKGETGSSGDTTVIITPPAESAN